MAHPGYDGMWLPPDQDPRTQATPERGERGCLDGYLDHYRLTLALKCDGLSPAQLATRAVPPSNISLLGLVRHMARVEHSWSRRVIEGHPDLPRLFDSETFDEDAGFSWADEPTEESVRAAFDLWQSEIAHAREVYAAASLDDLVIAYGDEIEVRDVVVHMVEEYARHVGHADLVRECLDGRAGV